jgi:RHS repeat-associated protein
MRTSKRLIKWYFLLLAISLLSARDIFAMPKPFREYLSLSEDDMVLPEKGLDFIFTRSFNSQTKFDGPLGIGWGFSFGASLIIDSEKGAIILKDYDGIITMFESAGKNIFNTKSNENEVISVLPDKKYERKIKNAGVQIFGADGLLERVTDEFGNSFCLVYNNDKLTSIYTPSGREINIETSEQGKITRISEPLGRKVEYQYNNSNLISVKDVFGGLTKYSYDDKNNITKIEYPDGSNREIVYEKDSDRIYELKGPGNKGAKYEYLGDNKRSVLFLSGYKVTYQDDPEKGERIVSDNNGVKSVLKYDKNNQLIESKDAIGRVSVYGYDKAGRMAQIVQPSGAKTEYVYDEKSGWMLSEKLNGKTVKQYEYDRFGNVTGVMDEKGLWTRYTYDKHSQLESKTDNKGYKKYYTYDTYGNLSQIINSDGEKQVWFYDAYGRTIEEIDALGNKVLYRYDKSGNLIKKDFSNGKTVTYGYDKNGRLRKTTFADGASEEYTYDTEGNLIEKKNLEGGISKYKYNENGQLMEEVNANTAKTTYIHDMEGQLIQKIDPLGGVMRMEYDGVGRLAKRIYPDGDSVEFIYDNSDNVIKKKYSDGETFEWKYDPSGLAVESISKTCNFTNKYDALGRLLYIEYKDSGQKIEFQYDSKSNINQISISGNESLSYMYDELNQLTSIRDQDGNGVLYQYQKGKRDFLVKYSNGITEEYKFDDQGSVKDVLVQNNGKVLFGFLLVRDDAGRIIEKKWLSGVSEKYEYDVMGRLSRFYQDDLNWEKYEYDFNDNIISVERPKGKVEFTYDKADRLLSDGRLAYQWDANGNLIRKQWEGGTISFTYDCENKLVKVSSSTGNEVQFAYDGNGKRTLIKTKEDKSIFLYCNEDISAELDKDSKVKRIYNHNLGIDDPIFFKEGGKSYFYHKDSLGSIIAISDERGEIANQYIYGPFGKTKKTKEGLENSFQFTGREYDETFGVYFYRARFYDPSICRFISEDLLKNNNLYAYVENNPINLNDPFGLGQILRSPQARVNDVADAMGFNRPKYTPGIPGGPNAYGAHQTTILGNNPEIKVTKLAVDAGPQQVQSTIFHENVHEIQRVRNPASYGSATGSAEAALEREAHKRTYEYAVRNGLSKEVQQHSLEAFQRYGGTQAELEAYMSSVGTRMPGTGITRALGVVGRAAGTAALAYTAFEGGYAVGTIIEDKTKVGKNMGIEDWRYEQITKNGKIERQEQATVEDLTDYIKRNAEFGNVTLQPGIDPNKIKDKIEWNLNNHRKPFEGIIETPEERKAREQKEREEAYARYEAETARQNIERRKKEEELEKVLGQVQGLISQARAAESGATAKVDQIRQALQTAKDTEAKINGMVDKLKKVSDKVSQLNSLSQRASSLTAQIQGANLSGDSMEEMYARAKNSRVIACDISANMQSAENSQAAAEQSRQAAADSQSAATQAKGAGANALAVAAKEETALAELKSIKQQWDAIQGEADSIKSQFSEAQGLADSADSAIGAVSSSGSEAQNAVGKIENIKNTILGLLAPYLSFPDAQTAIGQMNAIGSALKGMNAEGLIQEAQAVTARIKAKIAEGSSLISQSIPPFPIDIDSLEEKVADIRATAETIDLFESKVADEASKAQECANSATRWTKMSNAVSDAETDADNRPNISAGDSVTGPRTTPTGVQVQSGQTAGSDIETAQGQEIDKIKQKQDDLQETQPPPQLPPQTGPWGQGGGLPNIPIPQPTGGGGTPAPPSDNSGGCGGTSGTTGSCGSADDLI